MAALFLLGLFFHYLDDHLAVFQKLQKAQFFKKEFYDVCYDLGLSVMARKTNWAAILTFLDWSLIPY